MTSAENPKAAGFKGCGLVSFLAGIAAMSGGIYLIVHWNTIGSMARAGSIVLVVVGTLLILPLLLILSFQLFMKVFIWRIKKQLSKAGADIIAQGKSMYGQIHEFRPASEEDFESLDQSYYDTMREKLIKMNYRHLGDLVDKTIQEMGMQSPPIRVMAFADGSVTVGVYELGNSFSHVEGDKLRIFDVSTEFTDGTFLVTSNTQGMDMMTPPPQIHRRQQPLETTVEDLIRLHNAEKSKLLAAMPQAGCITIDTLDDAIESERRQQLIKNAFRSAIGYSDPEEVRRVSATVFDDKEVQDMAAEAIRDEKEKESNN